MSRTMAEKCRFIFHFLFFWLLNIFIVMRKEGEKINMKKILKISLFGHVLKKVSTSTFWCMVTTLGPCLVYT